MPVSFPMIELWIENSVCQESCIQHVLGLQWAEQKVCPKGYGHLCLWGMGAYEKCCDQKNNYLHISFYYAVIKQMLRDGLGGMI